MVATSSARSAVSQPPSPAPSPPPAALDPEVLDCLSAVIDPEIGLSVVDLGLVYRAARTAAGIEVDLTLTAQACPLGDMIVEDARSALRRRFVDAPVDVALVWEPAWSPDRITDHGLKLLGRTPRI
ncbi:metal-sulfur cluster assembly factor [Blastochloris sulfoviridis]|uniref:Metal-sulfur cluster assembly factor n=1 Tax=Blastochloris sulfoviridis TaxID=50712 RepID=A0A5M6HJL5_9HYPH|nr:metal-sulfur cluster assembly factor [Blastochloris sulfoviridis]